ncbi:Predicted amino acid racemase [Dethiosulfatibacter aminovorans DSM 17477]|uniref:Predicted amino acid racemase n=1 Tax=Dethiosulfatibacter aminovorans DSM 17477 TaxID=1121476 RepID=A0A1M6IRE5_9FIRM|nr:alanine racemase [Dethiosulfatibacter aminovorans]SHJ37022.1 Predicted amino acid racemase [Dethiosulfatibacter aminovorans DSM 17477]
MGKRYPVLNIDIKKLVNNARIITEKCNENGIDTACVIKGYNGIPEVAEEMAKCGCSQVASSRIDQLKDVKLRGMAMDTLLLRIPMMSELEEVIRYADISLNSQRETLVELDRMAVENNTKHRVILMRDLGDLREGIFDRDEFIETACFIENSLKGLVLEGIGTNLSCYGSVAPTEKNLSMLVEDAEEIEKLIDRKLRYVSGGATTTLPLFYRNKLPKGINHLRLGESIICAMDLPLYWDTDIEGLEKGVFTMDAQIIEIRRKPSYPIGEKCVNAFGETPEYEDRGIRLRALLAVGNRDVGDYSSLEPIDEGVELVGASSDHLIVDIEEAGREYAIGDIMKFNMYYQAVLFASDNRLMNIELNR